MNHEQILQQSDITSSQLLELLESRSQDKIDFALVDVREPDEIKEGFIEGCDLYCPTSDFASHIEALQNEKRSLVFYCRSGGRSAQVLQFLSQKDFSNISHLEGGITAYQGKIAKS